MADDASEGKKAELLLARLKAAVKDCNAVEAAAREKQANLVSKSKEVGELLLEAKRFYPAVKEFEAFIGKVHGLKLSRAYDLLRLAGGRTTDEELKKEARERKQKSRANKKKLAKPRPGEPEGPGPKPISVTTPYVTESPEISAEQRKRENANLGMTAAERSKRNLEWFAVACREYLPNITVEVHRQEAHRLVAELTQAKAA